MERPTIQTHGIYAEHADGRNIGVAFIANKGASDARDVTVRVTKRDGHSFEAQTDWLRVGTNLRLELDDFPTDPGGYEGLQIARIVIRFADRRKAAVYERREDYSQVTEPPVIPSTTEERLS